VIVGRQPINAAPEHTEHIEDVPEQLALGPGYLRPHINEDLTVLSGKMRLSALGAVLRGRA
jgi:hypothetical protein